MKRRTERTLPVSPRLGLCAFLLLLGAAAASTCVEATKVQSPAGLMLVSGNGQSGTVGQALPSPLVVKVVDLSGAGVPGTGVDWRVTGGRGGVSGDTGSWNFTLTDQTGQTMVTLTLGSTAGINTVSAFVAFYDGLAPVGFSATGLPGPTTKLAFTVLPSDVTAGAPIAPALQVAVQDAFGNTVSSATTSITLAITVGTGTGGATLSGTLSKPATSGVATFADLSIDRAGTGYTLTAAATGLTSATSTPFTVNASL